jgi:hypothetical protein
MASNYLVMRIPTEPILNENDTVKYIGNEIVVMEFSAPTPTASSGYFDSFSFKFPMIILAVFVLLGFLMFKKQGSL